MRTKKISAIALGFIIATHATAKNNDLNERAIAIQAGMKKVNCFGQRPEWLCQGIRINKSHTGLNRCWKEFWSFRVVEIDSGRNTKQHRIKDRKKTGFSSIDCPD